MTRLSSSVEFSEAHKKLPSGRLWSLLDMLDIKGSDFYAAASALQKTLGIILRSSTDENQEKINASTRESISGGVSALRVSLVDLGAEVTTLALDDLVEELASPDITYERLSVLLRELDSGLSRELSLVKLFVIERDKHKYYEPKAPSFGQDVLTKFPQATYEIDEASKCLALSRPTAAVFHLMRTMECGLSAVRKCLGIPDSAKPADRNWGAILRYMKIELDKRTAQPATLWKTSIDCDFFDEVYTSLDAVRNTWRNSTMHVENKYTDEEAEHVFAAVRGFMKKVASRLDEKGLPLA